VVDIFALLKFAKGNEKIMELKDTGFRITQKFVFDRIPKYREN